VAHNSANFKIQPCECNFVSQGHPLVRVAGLSGGAAIALGAYGAHGTFQQFKWTILKPFKGFSPSH